VVTPVLVKPGGDFGLAPAPEFVRPQDGLDKQDYEINASLRWVDGTPRWTRPCLAMTCTATSRFVGRYCPKGLSLSWSASRTPTCAF